MGHHLGRGRLASCAVLLLLSCGSDGLSQLPHCSPNCASPNGLKWVWIPGGTFEMGCSPGDDNCSHDEKPPHTVTLSGSEMLETEVTEEQYESVMGTDPSCDDMGGSGAYSPVECVTWLDARTFCEEIGGRLPTEAEWEYAARGGTTTRFYCGDDYSCLVEIAWYYEGDSDDHKHDVMEKEPNAFGLYDMLGNVGEWTADWYDPEYYSGGPADNPQGPHKGSRRVGRGSGFDFTSDLRVSHRYRGAPSSPAGDLGFRCARSE